MPLIEENRKGRNKLLPLGAEHQPTETQNCTSQSSKPDAEALQKRLAMTEEVVRNIDLNQLRDWNLLPFCWRRRLMKKDKKRLESHWS